MTTISGLESSTTYSIEVAAVNSAGTGVYSTPSTVVETDGKSYIHTCMVDVYRKIHMTS